MSKKYTKEYFIDKFEAIPEELWCTGVLTLTKEPNCHCALGHCGVVEDGLTWLSTEEADALILLFGGRVDHNSRTWHSVFYINDGYSKTKHHGVTPKERILNALRAL